MSFYNLCAPFFCFSGEKIMKTLAELKREAKSGILEGKFIHHSQFGANLPKRLQGWRKLIDSNSVAIYFLTSDGKKSELRLDKASLVDYDGQTLTIFNAGYRSGNVSLAFRDRNKSGRFGSKFVHAHIL